MHLLRSGVDINTIRIWLGHVSLQTTNLYAESDLTVLSISNDYLSDLHVAPKQTARWSWHQ